jgi:4-hydroxythreonine-4-phosphate dehydrogenase
MPAIAITAGDPCGIGPEVILKTLESFRGHRRAQLVVIGDEAVFQRTARRLRLRWPFRQGVAFRNCSHHRSFVPGRPTRAAGVAALEYLDCAIQLAQARKIQGLVTAPVTKWVIQQSHPPFVGHTEYLAHAFKVRQVAMMFASDRLRVVLLTRHVPLSRAGRLVNKVLVRQTLRLTADTLRRWFGIAHPRVGICGLNPHAGERGLFGTEERRILPVIHELNRAHRMFDGPLAADSLFANASRYDAIVCWYHDQGLIPFKMVARDQGCQLTLGLPIVRTSPDHGSALDIAGRGIAQPGSMRYALQLAIKLARC